MYVCYEWTLLYSYCVSLHITITNYLIFILISHYWWISLHYICLIDASHIKHLFSHFYRFRYDLVEDPERKPARLLSAVMRAEKGIHLKVVPRKRHV